MTRRIAWPTAAAAIVLTLSSSAAAQTRMVTSRIDSIVRAGQRSLGAPAISVAIMDGQRMVYSRAFGTADLENSVAASPATTYRAASIAKSFTAAAVMRLVREGKLELDSSARFYVRELPATYDRVTVRDLLRHTGGVRHYRDDTEFVSTRHCDSLTQALDIFAADPLEHAPGEKITYSSYGYTLLGIAIERVTGQRFSDYLRATVLQPAGMRSTRLDDRDIIPHRARGYDRAPDTKQIRNAALVDVSCRVPAGGFVSTAEDLARFVAALERGALVDSASVRMMMTSQITQEMIARTLAQYQLPAGYQPPGMGFGWAIEPDGHAAYNGGNQPGFTSMMYHVPARHLTVSIMINLEGAGDALTTLARQITEAYGARRAR